MATGLNFTLGDTPEAWVAVALLAFLFWACRGFRGNSERRSQLAQYRREQEELEMRLARRRAAWARAKRGPRD